MLCVFALVATEGCAQSGSMHGVKSAKMALQFTAAPSQAALYETYPISAAFSLSGPDLSSAQRNWIARVLKSPAYGAHRSRLRFANTSGGPNVPIVVYVDRAGTGETDRGGHVIGEPCNVWFDPVVHGVFPGTGALCAPPTPKPIN